MCMAFPQALRCQLLLSHKIDHSMNHLWVDKKIMEALIILAFSSWRKVNFILSQFIYFKRWEVDRRQYEWEAERTQWVNVALTLFLLPNHTFLSITISLSIFTSCSLCLFLHRYSLHSCLSWFVTPLIIKLFCVDCYISFPLHLLPSHVSPTMESHLPSPRFCIRKIKK